MSLFQCTKCGCVENTATSDGGYLIKWIVTEERVPLIYKSYKDVLGSTVEDEFGEYCCICNPMWFGEDGSFGLGKCPEKKEWHGKFDRIFLEMGKWETNEVGNLRHKATGETNFRKHALAQNSL